MNISPIEFYIKNNLNALISPVSITSVVPATLVYTLLTLLTENYCFSVLMANISDVFLPWSAGEDLFELEAVLHFQI